MALAGQRVARLEHILADIETAAASRAQRRQWNPQNVGEIDIRIAADGSWFHEGRPLGRETLVRLFAGILRRDGDDYYLVTPAEKWRITVDDAPFVANRVERVGDALVFTTNTGERVIADRDHPIRVDLDGGRPRPYLQLGDGIDALIGRGAFFELADGAREERRNGRGVLFVESRGHRFTLGEFDAD